MKDGEPVRFIRACVEDTGILTAVLAWLEAERSKVIERLADTVVNEEIYRLQGEARNLRRLSKLIVGMVKGTEVKQRAA